MARFYKTSSAAPMDYMYQMNIPLMQNVLAANEAGVNQQIQQAESVGDLASKFNYLTPDADRAREITKEYDQKVNDITAAIQADPMQWRKKKQALRDLGRDLQSNYQVGEIGKIAGNYAKYKELDDYITKREEAGKLTPYEGSVFRQRAMQSLEGGTGFDAKTGKYNIIQTTKPMDTIDIRERASKFIDNMKANEGLEWDTQAGQYFKKTTQGRVYIDPERIIQAAMSGIMGDTELQQYMRQRSDFGLMSGIFDKEGKFINPYNYVNAPASDIEKQQIATLQNQINNARKTNPQQAQALQAQLDNQIAGLAQRQRLEGNKESGLFPVIASLAAEYSYQKVKSGVDLKNNSLYNLGVNLDYQGRQKAADRAQKQDFFNQKFKQAADFHKDFLELGYYKARDKPVAGKGGAGTAKSKDTKVTEVTIPTSVGDQDANPWGNSQIYTNNGLSTIIDNSKKDMDALTTKVNSYQEELLNTMKGRNIDKLTPQERAKVDQLTTQLNNVNEQLQDKSANATWARQWYNQSIDFAVNNTDPKKGPVLTPEERELYNRFKDDRMAKKLEEDINSEAQSYAFPSLNQGKVSRVGRFMEKLTGAGQDEDRDAQGYTHMDKRMLLTAYSRTKAKVDAARQFYLDKARQTTDQAPTIEFGTEDQKLINGMMQNRTHGLQIFNFEGKEGAGIDLGDEAMTFKDGSLQNYIKEHNGEMEWLGVSPSLGFNDANTGAVARVRIKNKDGKESSVGKIPSDKDFYVTLDPATQQSIGLKYAVSKDPQVAALGNQLLSGRDQIIRNRFMDVRNQLDPQTNEYGPVKRVKIPIPQGDLAVNVRSFYRGNGDYDYYVTTVLKDGSEVPLKSTGATNGFFDSIDHFISDFNTNLGNNQKLY